MNNINRNIQSYQPSVYKLVFTIDSMLVLISLKLRQLRYFTSICCYIFSGLFICCHTLFSQVKQKTASKQSAVQNAPAQKENSIKQTEEFKPVINTQGKDALAIYHFTTAAGYSYDYALSAGNAVEAGFVRSGRFMVVERNRFGIINEEEKFKEANMDNLVKKAAKLGAKTLVTGHIVGVTDGVGSQATSVRTPIGYIPVSGRNICQISLAFKIIDVESGAIAKSEIILGKGQGNTFAEAIQNAYVSIDGLIRQQIGDYLPQRFKLASIVEKKSIKKGGEYLEKFKIWGGSEHGLKVGDMIEINAVSYITNPDTKKRIQEKRLLAQAKVVEINSESTSTCSVVNPSKAGEQLLNTLSLQPDMIVFEYKGGSKKSGWPF